MVYNVQALTCAQFVKWLDKNKGTETKERIILLLNDKTNYFIYSNGLKPAFVLFILLDKTNSFAVGLYKLYLFKFA